MIIKINSKQFNKILKEQELGERLGVPEGILETGEDLFNDIMDKMKSLSSVSELENGFEIEGNYKVGDHLFKKINVGFDLMEDPDYFPELAGAQQYKQSKLEDYDVLHHVTDVNELNLRFRIFVNPETTVQEIIDLFLEDTPKMISTFTHEIGHGYEGVKKRTEKVRQRVGYQTLSSNKFGDIEPLNEFLYYSYYVHAIENVVRASELAQLLRLHGVSKKDFLSFFQGTEIYKMLKDIQNYSYEGLREKLMNEVDSIRNMFKVNKIKYKGIPDKEIIDKVLELFYINVSNWKTGSMKELLTTNFLEAISGFEGGKDKFFRKYVSYVTKFSDNPTQFYLTEIQNLNYQATKMIKKLSKLYDYLSNETNSEKK